VRCAEWAFFSLGWSAAPDEFVVHFMEPNLSIAVAARRLSRATKCGTGDLAADGYKRHLQRKLTSATLTANFLERQATPG
jgi:hypothetical protein